MEVVLGGGVQILADFAEPAASQDAAIARAAKEAAAIATDIVDGQVAAKV
jgi:hypothetical protein